MSYTNDIASPEIEIAGEATGSFFADAKNKHSDLKAMLDGTKDNLKMEAMKRIISMIAKGKDASDLFPAVVKNVASKNPEVKKLVYVYLMRYAEEQQDLALLSISTFQRALKDPNQLIRASALRVLSSIRVPIIAPIMMLAIKESVRDMSPYVRKVAAHAISKLYSLDPELKDQLIEVIDHLLADKTTLVLGSAVHAFEEVCPERFDLIHKHYRKLCQLLIDIDEWGQVVVIDMLTRYGRTQFLDPNDNIESEHESMDKFYSSEESDSSHSDKHKKNTATKSKSHKDLNVVDPDLRLLIKNTKPLLQSRNTAVVLAVAQLYFYLAPKSDVGVIAKAMIRLLRSHREVQSIILTNIATISAKRRVQYVISQNMFEPFLKSFFVRSSDPTHVKLLKLEILTNLATQTNISMILREFQTYVASQDKEFAAATIDAIGRCACNIKEVTDVCLSGLVQLLANKNETVVAQSVVVIKKLLQSQPTEHEDIIKQMAKLVDTVKIAAARASIVWLIGEYCQRVPKVAPDVLRKMAVTFANEDDYVKLQVLTLAVKLYLTNKDKTAKLVEYVFQLDRYDQNYDLRDRARFLKNLIMAEGSSNRFAKSAADIFLTQKPAPTVESSFKDRDQYQLGTLSHVLNQRCTGYTELPSFPDVAPDASARNLPLPAKSAQVAGTQNSPAEKPAVRVKKFYSDEEEEEEVQEEEEDEEEEDEDEEEKQEDAVEKTREESEKSEDESEEDEEEEDQEEDEEESLTENEETIDVPKDLGKKAVQQAKATTVENTADLLLDLDFGFNDSTATVMAPSVPSDLNTASVKDIVAHSALPSNELLLPTAPAQYVNATNYASVLDKISGHGLSVCYRYTRLPSLFSNRMCSIELKFTNELSDTISLIKLNAKKLHHGMDVQGLTDMENLFPGQSRALTVGIDFCDTTRTIPIELCFNSFKIVIDLSADVGEQLEPVLISAQVFKNLQAKLSGMNETSGKFRLKSAIHFQDVTALCRLIYEHCNVNHVSDLEDKICFAAQTLSGKCPVLISLTQVQSDETKLTVNCEKMVVGSMLYKHLKCVLSSV